MMESIRDADAVSTIPSDNTSLACSTISQINEPKINKNTIDADAAKLALITEAINETVAENNARCKDIMELLSTLDLNPKSMPKDIQDLLIKAAAIMRAEGLSEMDVVPLKICMEQKKREAIKKCREERNLKMKYNQLCDRHSSFLEKQKKVRIAVESLQEVMESMENKNEEEYANRIFTATKVNEYRQTVHGLEENLKDLEVEDCYADKILEKYNAYLELLKKLADVDESLSKYGELPPNLLEARAVVEEKEKYLKELDCALFEKMQ